MEGYPGDGVVLNFLGRARGVVRTGASPTLQSDGGGSSGVITMSERIRKLTEVECFRLMGFEDAEIDRIREAKDEKGRPLFGKTIMYQFAGNSVVVDCFAAITKEIIRDMEKKVRADTLDFYMGASE